MTMMDDLCAFSEVSKRRTKVFLLCKMAGRAVHLPVSTAGEERNVRGVRLKYDSTLLTINPELLPKDAEKLVFGISVSVGFDLIGNTPLMYQFRVGKAEVTPQEVVVPQVVGNRYAIIAIAANTPKGWDARRLHEPQVFPNRRRINTLYPVPDWWQKSRA